MGLVRLVSYYAWRYGRVVVLDNSYSIVSMKNFLIKLITAHTGISSKRVCGVIGWLVCLCITIGCTITNIEAPQVTDTVLLCCMGLLGIDSVTGIWRK